MNVKKTKLYALMLGAFALSAALAFLITAFKYQVYKPAFEETTEYEQILSYAARNLHEIAFSQTGADTEEGINRATRELNESNLFAKVYLNDALLIDTTLPSMDASDENMAGEYHIENTNSRSYLIRFWTDGTYTKECSIENLSSEYRWYTFFRKYAVAALLAALVLGFIVGRRAVCALPENTSGAALKQILCAAAISAVLAALCIWAGDALYLRNMLLTLCRRVLFLNAGLLLVYAIVCFVKRALLKQDATDDEIIGY